MAPRKNLLKNLFYKIAIMLLSGIALFSNPAYGQADTVKNLKNTVRLNLSNPVLFDWKFTIIGYERVINKHQTISGSIGRVSLPRFSFLSDSLDLKDQYNEWGIHFSLDYRFYLHKENKYLAPRGVYIGPYYAYNHYSRDLTWSLNTGTSKGDVMTGFDLTANLIGAQLGYQFILWNRLSLDLVLMGPGLWHFNLKSHFNTTLTSEDEALLLEKLNELLKDKFPGTDFTIKGGDFEVKKNTSTNVMGLRYMVNIGFRF